MMIDRHATFCLNWIRVTTEKSVLEKNLESKIKVPATASQDHGADLISYETKRIELGKFDFKSDDGMMTVYLEPRVEKKKPRLQIELRKFDFKSDDVIP